jgi:hypothetical protein
MQRLHVIRDHVYDVCLQPFPFELMITQHAWLASRTVLLSQSIQCRLLSQLMSGTIVVDSDF